MPVLHPEWLVPAEFPVLAAEEVHVWLSVLPAAEESVSHLARLLSPDEQARAARFHFPKDRAAFVTARGRLRTLLGRYLRTPPEKIRFILNAHGKPELPVPAPLQFNLSHSGELAAFAFTRHHRVGVDVEQVRADFANDSVAERFFAPGEVTQLRALPAAAQAAAFFECWTRKESFVKARGEGLSLGLEQFEVSVGGPAQLLSVAGGDAARWTMHDLHPADGYAGAVAVDLAQSRLRRWRWS